LVGIAQTEDTWRDMTLYRDLASHGGTNYPLLLQMLLFITEDEELSSGRTIFFFFLNCMYILLNKPRKMTDLN
jgi:hypothetical protein